MGQSRLMTLRAAYAQLYERLGERAEAQYILECAMGGGRLDVRLDEQAVPPQAWENALEMAGRRLSGEPLAYVLGRWWFHRLELKITSDVLIPRPDTETLAEAALEAIKPLEAPRVLDLCCGSGCVGLALAYERSEAMLTLADISPEALAVARENAARYAPQAAVVQMDALAPPPEGFGPFDLICSNPPYIDAAEYEALDKSVRAYEPKLALLGGEDGLDFYRAIAQKWQEALVPGGILAFEVGYRQAQDVQQLLKAYRYANVISLPDINRVQRVVLGEKRT